MKGRSRAALFLLVIIIVTSNTTSAVCEAYNGLSMKYYSVENNTITFDTNDKGKISSSDKLLPLVWYSDDDAIFEWLEKDYVSVYYNQTKGNLLVGRVDKVEFDKGPPPLLTEKGKLALTHAGVLKDAKQFKWLFVRERGRVAVVDFKGHKSKLKEASKEDDENEGVWVAKNIAKALNHLGSGQVTKNDVMAINGILQLIGDTIPESDDLVSAKNLNTKEELPVLYYSGNQISKAFVKKHKSKSDPNPKPVSIMAKLEDTYITYYLKYYTSAGEQVAELNTFNTFIQNYSKKSKQKDCEVLNGLTDLYKDYNKALDKHKEQESQNVANSVTSQSVRDFNSQSAYVKWATVLIDYIQAGGDKKKYKLDKSIRDKYKVEEFDTYCTNNRDNSKLNDNTTLHNEEILRLKAFAYVACTKSGKQVKIPDHFVYPNGYQSKIVLHKNTSISAIKEDADSAIEEHKNQGDVVYSLSTMIANYDAVAKYLSAKIVGFETGNPFKNKAGEDASVLKNSPYIESLIPDKESKICSIHYPVMLKQAERLPVIAGSESAYNAYLDLQHTLLLVGSYAKNDAGLKADDPKAKEPHYKNKSLDKFLASVSKPTGVDIPTNIKKTLIEYIGIYRGLKYLGIQPFTPQLKAIYEYYNQIVSFESNPGLKAYDPSKMTGEAMRDFFSIEQQQLSYYYSMGIELSATYVPMQTNLYDVNSLTNLEDISFVEKFHYPFGFYRKALYIDTNVKSAVDRYVTGKKKKLRVAKLRDLLEPEKDITLYLDDNFYNVKELAELQDMSYNKLANTETAGKKKQSAISWLTDKWSEWRDTDVESITKAGGIHTYSDNVKNKVSEYKDDKEKGGDYVLSSDKIDQYLTVTADNTTGGKVKNDVYDEYTPMQSYAIVSAIYRQSSLYDVVQEQNAEQSPVFISSPNLAGVKGIEKEQWNTIYNYIMLKNLEGNMSIDYKTTLDLDSVIYMDVYGNILTESGLVIIPAASNATLYKENSYSVYTAGFLSLCDNGYELPSNYANSEEFMKEEGTFRKDEETSTWRLSNKRIDGMFINFTDLPLSDQHTLQTFMELQKKIIDSEGIKFNERVWLITEVMRGAPQENINKEFEGLKGTRNVNKYGIYLANTLDELTSTLLRSSSNGNSLVTLPNLAYMEGVEYVILFLFKLIFAVMLFMLFITVYLDAVQGYLGIKTFARFIMSIALFVMIAFMVPKLLDFSYYQVNKRLLKREAEYVALLNLEKQSEGREIGVYNVTEPETETTLYLKIDDLSIPWYEVLDKVLVSNAFQTMQQVYDEAFESNLMSELPGIKKKSNGLYMDLDFIFKSSSIEYDAKDNLLYQQVNATPYASYATPYYVILDQLISRINEYNNDGDTPIKNFQTRVQNGGAIRTMGVCEYFFTSDYFMQNSQDVLGFKHIYGTPTTLVEKSPFTKKDINKMKDSLWYAGTDMGEDVLVEKLNKIDKEARRFIVDNRDLLGKVTDETFLKVMALSLAVEHNDTFGIKSASSIEIFDIDTRDIIRLSVAPRRLAMTDSSKSFARFIYDNAGTFGVFVTAILLAVYYVSTIIKPACMIIMLICMISALLFRKVSKRDQSIGAIEGFLISLALMCGTNVLYGIMLKISMMLPSFGVTMGAAVILQITIQVIYLILLGVVTGIIVLDWKEVGFNKFRQLSGKAHFSKASVKRLSVSNMAIKNRDPEGHYERSYRHSVYDNKRRTRGLTGNNFYEKMKERDNKRRNK